MCPSSLAIPIDSEIERPYLVIPKPFAKGYEELVFNWEISIVEDDGVENLDRGTQHRTSSTPHFSPNDTYM
jgi:hypothetical protein